MKTNLEDLKLLQDNYSKQICSLDQDIKRAAEEKFSNSNGCKTCRGRGWVVTWDTMDSMSGCYHESALCPEELCNKDTRNASGIWPQNNKYDNFHNNSRWFPEYTKDQIKLKTNIERNIADIKRKISIEEQKWSVSSGKVVRVTKEARGKKARRVPVGVEGLVKKLHTNDWGTTKAIVIDKDGKQWWPTISQLTVIDPDPNMEVWHKLDMKNREESGFPIVITIKKKTARAVLVRTTTSKEIWIPFSQVPELKTSKKSQTLSVSVPMWIAEKNGFITKDNR